MSHIFDTLRRGRVRRTPLQKPDAVQTDVVLQTLGYGRRNDPRTAARLWTAGAVGGGIILAFALWLGGG